MFASESENRAIEPLVGNDEIASAADNNVAHSAFLNAAQGGVKCLNAGGFAKKSSLAANAETSIRSERNGSSSAKFRKFLQAHNCVASGRHICLKNTESGKIWRGPA